MSLKRKSILWGVLAPNAMAWTHWLDEAERAGTDLQRCKRIRTMLDVYVVSKGGVEIVWLPDWTDAWTPAQVGEIRRRLK